MQLPNRPIRNLLALTGIFLLLATARADERFFTYSYEPKVIPQGALELEHWATMRNGRERVYTRWDVRQELEVGLTDRLTTALYLNWKNQWGFRPDGQGGWIQVTNATTFRGWSSEWKLKLSDPTADPIGVLLYGELQLDRHEWELEGKLVFGKNFGPLLTVYNAILEREAETELEPGGETETEVKWVFENTGGFTYRFGPFAAGLEGRTSTTIREGSAGPTAVFLGPVLHGHTERWWTTLTFLYQLTDVLDDHERTETRLLIGVSL